MKKWSRYLFFLGIWAILSLGGSANAGEYIVGKGVIKAMGAGSALFQGSMVLKMSGSGFLLIDPGDETLCPVSISVQGAGRKYVLEDGKILYAGWHGRALLRGCEFRVAVSGSNIDLLGIGNGRAYLSGCGWFRTHSTNGAWNSGIETRFGPVDHGLLNQLLQGDLDPSQIEMEDNMEDN